MFDQRGAERVPLAAGRHSRREAVVQSRGIRAVAHERCERCPLLFDGDELGEDVFAFDGFDALAKGLARGNGFTTLARHFGGRFDFATFLRDACANGVCAGGKPFGRGRVRRHDRLPRRFEPAEVSFGAVRVGNDRRAFDGVAQQCFLATLFFFRGPPRVFGVFDRLQHGAGTLGGRLLLAAGFDRLQLRLIWRVGVHDAVKRGKGDVLVVAVQHGVEQFVRRGHTTKGRQGNRFDLGVTGDGAQHSLVGNSGQRGLAHGV